MPRPARLVILMLLNNNMFFSIDLRKAMANYREEHYAIKSELNGAMTLPNQATVPEAPVVCLAVFNQYAEAVGYSVQRECTYHFYIQFDPFGPKW